MQYRARVSSFQSKEQDDGCDIPFDVNFRISALEGPEFKVRVTMRRLSALNLGGFSGRTDRGNESAVGFFFRKEAVRKLKAYLGQGVEGIKEDEQVHLEITAADALTPVLPTTKICKFYEDVPHSPTCTRPASEDRLKGATTLHVCRNSCNLPDTELLCSHLVHPETMSVSFRKHLTALTPSQSEIPKFDDRMVVRAHCNLGKIDIGQYSAVADVGDCQLGKRERDCWQLIYTPPQPRQEMSLDLLADRVLAELRTLNMVFQDQLKHEPFKPPDFATGREFVRECSHPQDLSNNLNALTDIFAHMDFGQFLSQVPPGTKSLKHLSSFLQKRFPEHNENVVQVFRDIRTLALYYPRHSKLDEPVLDAHRRLGLVPPIEDYGKAWRTMLQNFFQALRELKNLMLELE